MAKERQQWKKTGKEHDKYLKGGYIIPDRRYIFDFELKLVKPGEVAVRRVYTRADTIKEAENLVAAVATSLVQEDGWEKFEVKMAA